MKLLVSIAGLVTIQGSLGNELPNLRRGLNGAIECIGLIKELDFEDKSGKTIMSCAKENGQAIDIEGVDEDWINDRAEKGLLQSGIDTLILPSGTVEVGGKIIIPNGSEITIGRGRTKSGRRLATTTGNPTVLAVRVIAPDAQTTSSENQISDYVFGTSGNTVNLKSQYSACSHNKLNFVAKTGTVGGVNIVNGVTTVTISQTVNGVSDGTIRNAVTSALNAKFGVNSPSSLANYVMYCLPPGTSGGWIAYAYVNSWNSVYNNQWCNYVSGQMHEIGHNLNLAHSGEGTAQYADQSGMMGYSYGSLDTPVMCFNGPKYWSLGWFNDDNVQPNLAVGQTEQVTLVGEVSYNPSDSNKVVLKLNTPTSNDYYVTFNDRSGFNSGTQEGGNQVLVHETGGEGTGYSQSYLLAKLNAGGSYTIPNFASTGSDLVIDVVSITSSPKTAVVSVTLGADLCANTNYDDGLFCNGVETCDPNTGAEIPGNPPCNQCEICNETNDTCDPDSSKNYDDGLFCNGVETCNPNTGLKVDGTPPCRGLCESCDETNDTCNPLNYDDGLYCNGVETCNPNTGLKVDGTPPCGQCQNCNETTDQCEASTEPCCGDGVCNGDENCNTCSADCKSYLIGASCGNGLCEDGEDCTNCAADCAGVTGGKPANRYCCAGGPNGCNNSRCTSGSFTCSTDEVIPGSTCCGDGVCESPEDYVVCSADCVPPVPTPTPTKNPTPAPVPTPAPAPVAAPCPVCDDGLDCCFPQQCTKVKGKTTCQ